jgi:hypothetical protein
MRLHPGTAAAVCVRCGRIVQYLNYLGGTARMRAHDGIAETICLVNHRVGPLS